MKDENVLYWLWLSEKCAIATKDFRKLAERFEDPFELYRLETEEIEHIEGISERLKNKLSDKSLENAYSTLKYCKDNKVNIISYRDERYPKRLKEIENPPVLLYVLGRLPDIDNRLCIGRTSFISPTTMPSKERASSVTPSTSTVDIVRSKASFLRSIS